MPADSWRRTPEGMFEDIYEQLELLNRARASAPSPEPVGTVKLWGAGAVPARYLELDGTTVAQADYPDLFALWGTTYNTGGETGTDFRLPNPAAPAPLVYIVKALAP